MWRRIVVRFDDWDGWGDVMSIRDIGKGVLDTSLVVDTLTAVRAQEPAFPKLATSDDTFKITAILQRDEGVLSIFTVVEPSI